MKKLIVIGFILLIFLGCVKKEDKSSAIPKFSTLAQRDAIILKELEKQTNILDEINQKLANQQIHQTGKDTAGD